MDKFELMKRFIAVCEAGSFTQAAEILNMPKSAISTSITSLESELNVRLLQRTTRQLSVTEAGERYLVECRRILKDLDQVEQQILNDSSAVSGNICIDMPGRFMTTTLLPRIQEWFELYPETHIELRATDFRIDPVKDNVDCLIRVGHLEISDFIAKPLGQYKIVNCVSPKYVSKFGLPQTLKGLEKHYVIDYSPAQKSDSTFEYYKKNKTYKIKLKSLVQVNNTQAYLHACLGGMGIAQLPEIGVKHLIASGELISILPSYTCEDMPVTILYPSRQYLPKRVSLWMEWFKSILVDAPEM